VTTALSNETEHPKCCDHSYAFSAVARPLGKLGLSDKEAEHIVSL